MLLTCLLCCCVPAQSATEEPAAERRPTLAEAVQPDLEMDTDLKRSMTPTALEVAEIISVLPLIEKLRRQQSASASLPQNAEGLERVVANQRVIYSRIKINSYMLNAHLEVMAVNGKINAGLAELADRKAMIADQRARTLRRTSFINLVSGGLTKIGGYSIALTPASVIPTNILEVFDGTVQTTLSVFTLRQQKQEARLSKSRPQILNSFLSGNNLSGTEFPRHVWSFLNRVPPQSLDKRTRRQTLIDRWAELGRLGDDQRDKKSHYSSNLIPSIGENFRLDDLDDTVAMTSDLKSIISTMEIGLTELGQNLEESYKNDPEI